MPGLDARFCFANARSSSDTPLLVWCFVVFLRPWVPYRFVRLEILVEQMFFAKQVGQFDCAERATGVSFLRRCKYGDDHG